VFYGRYRVCLCTRYRQSTSFTDGIMYLLHVYCTPDVKTQNKHTKSNGNAYRIFLCQLFHLRLLCSILLIWVLKKVCLVFNLKMILSYGEYPMFVLCLNTTGIIDSKCRLLVVLFRFYHNVHIKHFWTNLCSA